MLMSVPGFWKGSFMLDLCYSVHKFSKGKCSKIGLESGTTPLCQCLSGKLHTTSVTPSRSRINIPEHLQHLINSIFINAMCKKLFYFVIETTSPQVLLLINYNWRPNVYILVKISQLFFGSGFSEFVIFLTQLMSRLFHIKFKCRHDRVTFMKSGLRSFTFAPKISHHHREYFGFPILR